MNQITLHSFDGGIHPQENKAQSTQTAIAKLPLPEQLIIPVSQHIGAPADVIVDVGDLVLKGQMIAQPKGFVSAAIHAPSSGKVVAIEQRELPHSSGLEGICIIIDTDGEDRWVEEIANGSRSLSNFLEADNNVLVQRIRECGITGLGGAGFPTSVKMSLTTPSGKKKIDTLIINAAECEPYITADDMLMRERANESIQGIQILLKLTSAKQCFIGIEDNKPEAIKAMEAALSNLPHQPAISVVTIPTKYPSGGEKQLIKILTGKEVPSGGIPADIGMVCQNIGTCEAVYHAIAEGKPLISRITTLTGESIIHPQNVEVLIGTPVKHLLAFAGFQQEKSLFQKLLGSIQPKPRIIMGGPMMGFTLSSDELPILKSSNCILAPSQKELPANDIASACIRCGLCTEACPADLLPQQLYWFSKSSELEKAEQHNIADCIECGACSYVCPSQIPLVQYYRYTKGAIKEEKAAQEKSNRSKIRFEARQDRLDKEAAEKEAKRQARAVAAEKAQAAKKAAAAKAALEEASTSDSASNLNKLSPNELSPNESSSQSTKGTVLEKNDASREDIEKKLRAQKDRLDKTQQRVSIAQEQGSETLPALQKGLDKQMQKLKELEEELTQFDKVKG